MFWGLIMEPQKRYSQTVKKAFHISHAAMDTATGDGDICQVMVVVDGQNFLLCTLQKGKTIQTPLDLFFREGEVISFITNGKCHVHLTGYLDLEYEDPSEGEEEDDEEEVPELVEQQKSKKAKRKLEASPELNNLTKKQKKEQKKKEAETKKKQEDSDDSSDDDSVDIQKLLEEDDTDEADDSYMPNDDSMEKLEDDDNESDDDDDEEDDDDDDSSSDDKSPEVITPVKKDKKDKNKQQQSPLQNGHSEKKNKNKENEQKKGESVEKSPTTPQKEKKILTGNVAIEDLKVGQGAVAKPGKMVQVLYEGRLKSNNKMFDSCQKNPGFKFRLGKNEVIKGWDVGVVGMRIGGKRRIVCPPGMAYGNKGSPPLIPGNSTLVFDVELKAVN